LSAPSKITFTSLTKDDYDRAAATRTLRVGGAQQSPAELRADLFEGDMVMSGSGTGRSVLASATRKWDRNQVPVQISSSYSSYS